MVMAIAFHALPAFLGHPLERGGPVLFAGR